MDVMLSNHSFSKIVTGGVEQSLGTDTYQETCYGLGLSLTL